MRELKTDQAAAFEDIKIFINLAGGGIHLLTGCAGVGKTYLLGDLVDEMKKHGKVLVTAPTNKAVKVLKRFIITTTDFSTTHSALGMKEHIDESGNLTFKRDPMLGYPADNYTHIVVDEASMIGDEMFVELIQLSESGKKILLVGDPLQIPPVNHEFAPPFDREVRRTYNIEVSSLETIVRQAENSSILQFSKHIRENIHKPIQILNSQEVKNDIFMIKRREEGEIFQNQILPLYKSEHYNRSTDYIKVIAWRNKTVDKYNDMIRKYIFGDNLPKIVQGEKLILDAPVMDGRKVIIATNEEVEVLSCEVRTEENFNMKYYWTRVRVIDRGVFDEYMLKVIHEDSEDRYKEILRLQAILAKSYPKKSYQAKSAWLDYYEFIQYWHHVKYSYCITAHKSQGSTYNIAYVHKWDIDTNINVYERNRILYTACTRPSQTLYVIY